MANPEHVEIVRQGAEAISAFQEKNDYGRLDLSRSELSGGELNRGNSAAGDHFSPVYVFFAISRVNTRSFRLNFASCYPTGLPRTHGSAPGSTPQNPCVRFERHDHTGEDHGDIRALGKLSLTAK